MSTSSTGRSMARRYAPFLAIIALQLLLLTLTPSSKTTTVTQGAASNGETVDGGATDTGVVGDSGAVATDTGAGATTGGATSSGGTTGSGVTGATKTGTAAGSGATAGATGTAAATGGQAAAAGGQKVDALGRPLEGDKAKCAPGGLLQENITSAPMPCTPKFVGDNGGATAQGVTGDTITVVVAFPDYDAAVKQGLVAAGLAMTPDQIKESNTVWQDFFNKHFELYGRKIKVIDYSYKCTDAPCERAEAKAIVAKYKPFAVTFYAFGIMPEPMADQLTQLGVVTQSGPPLSDNWYKDHAPYAWGLVPQGFRAADMVADYYCKRMQGKNATLAGDPTMRVKPRKLAVISVDTPASAEVGVRIRQQVTGGMCGSPADGVTTYTQSADAATRQSQGATLTTRMKNDGITTRVSATGLQGIGSQDDDKQQYYPENVLLGVGNHDDDLVGQFYSATVSTPTQMANTFGIGFYPKAAPPAAKPYYKAAKDVNPKYEPPYLSQGPFGGLELLVHLFQNAGPRLTAKNIEAGARSSVQIAGYQNAKPWAGWKCCDPFAPEWNFSAPNAYTAWADAREIYWSSSAVSPSNNNPGAWLCVQDCKRFEVGGWKPGEPKQ